MFADDRETFQALQLLENEIHARRRPLVIWLGAGVSTWAGYPLWNDLAAEMHSSFSRTENAYNNRKGAQLLEAGTLPSLFQLMHDCNVGRYHTLLAETFQPREISPVYERLIRTLSGISPHHILTTNVDESLERNIAKSALLQRQDFQRAANLLLNESSFICKLHGSISAVQSTVFSTSDYEALTSDETYLRLLRQIFTDTNVVFLGYSVRDEYVINTLIHAIGERELFGAGEHFVVTAGSTPLPSERLRRIRYQDGLNRDLS